MSFESTTTHMNLFPANTTHISPSHINTGDEIDLSQMDSARCSKDFPFLSLNFSSATTELFFYMKFSQSRNISGSSDSSSSSSSLNSSGNGSLFCRLVLAAPERWVVRVRFLYQTCVRSNFVFVREPAFGDKPTESEIATKWTGCEGIHDPLSDFLSRGHHHVDVVFNVSDVTVAYSARMRIEILRWCEQLRALEIRFLSQSHGFVQTPDWGANKADRYTGAASQSVAIVVAPAERVILISISSVGTKGELDLYEGEDMAGQVVSKAVWRRYDRFPRPMVLNTSAFSFHYNSFGDDADPRQGTRLQFSFHSYAETPQKLDNGLFNCSVPNWRDFRFHLDCNLFWDCLEGDDETLSNCPYRPCRPPEGAAEDGHVRLGGLEIRGKCLWLVRVNRETYNTASALMCVRVRGQLVTLKNHRKTEEVLGTLYRIIGPFMEVSIGLQTASPLLPSMYRYSLVWIDGTMAFDAHYVNRKKRPACGLINDKKKLTLYDCNKMPWLTVLCEADNTKHTGGSQPTPTISPVHLGSLSDQGEHVFPSTSVFQCSDRHFTHTFLACDMHNDCWLASRDTSASGDRKELWDVPPLYSCGARMELLPPLFLCAGSELLAYTFVCDFREDCFDGSDENFCWFPPCVYLARPCGSNSQCYMEDERCDGVDDCINAVDEEDCDREGGEHNKMVIMAPAPPPAILNFNGRGNFNVTRFPNGTVECPETHFQCAYDGYCLPVYVRCNQVADCPGREDEEGCESFTCAGFYRCRRSEVCLHPSQVCDGWSQCPQRDDELLCNFTCLPQCTCHGLALTCPDLFPSHLYPQLRYLDASDSGLTPSNLTHNLMLIHLSLRGCHLRHLANLSFPNLRSVDLRDNLVSHITYQHLSDVSHLQVLLLSGNPLTSVFIDSDGAQALDSVLSLDLSNVITKTFHVDKLAGFHNLRHLNLTDCRVQHIKGAGFQPLKLLRVLDLRGSDVQDFPHTVFQGLEELQAVYADNYKLCCPATLPGGFNVRNCRAPFDELSSCESLLQSNTYRFFLFMFAILVFFGNSGSLVIRGCFQKESSKSGFSVVVSYLCVADLLMGFYLIVIGVADRVYQDRYLWEDRMWKESAGCELAGFLSFTSNELSASIICLITIDRFLALRFPFSQFRLHRGSAHLISLSVFFLGFFLAAVPWLPMNRHWRFYNQNGICIPLPITQSEFAGHSYSFGVIIIFNLVLFVLIAAGQAFIYISIRTNAMTDADVGRRSQDLRIARRLVSIAMSDFLCWFPIGLLGILASQNVVIPSEVNVGIAIFVLPLNSALNPFLYTLNAMLDRLRQRREDALLRLLEEQADNL